MEINSKVINYKDQLSLTWMLWPRAALVINRIFITFLSAPLHVLNYCRLHKLQLRSVVQLDSSNLFPLLCFNTVPQLLLQKKKCLLFLLFTVWSDLFNFYMIMVKELKNCSCCHRENTPHLYFLTVMDPSILYRFVYH